MVWHSRAPRWHQRCQARLRRTCCIHTLTGLCLPDSSCRRLHSTHLCHRRLRSLRSVHGRAKRAQGRPLTATRAAIVDVVVEAQPLRCIADEMIQATLRLAGRARAGAWQRVLNRVLSLDQRTEWLVAEVEPSECQWQRDAENQECLHSDSRRARSNYRTRGGVEAVGVWTSARGPVG